ncbi:MAG: class I SAM-dependent methyltransferase [Gammaproteobacteria bacterium]|nr:class I SAM-dependent methyltransferase [Gammaproteobacteria bacterium]
MSSGTDWLNTATGRNLLREEVRQVRRTLESTFGDQFIQVGSWGGPGLFRRLARTRRATVLSPHHGPGVDVVCDPETLPLVAESIDAVLMPHTLELAEDPYAVLREVDRVMRSDGQLVVLGFNPWGLWGLMHRIGRQGFPPGALRLISDGRLSDWLRLLDFRVHHSAFYYYATPCVRGVEAISRRDRRPAESPPRGALAPTALARIARHIRPLAACYVVVAKRQTHAVTPIRLPWRRQTRVLGRLVNPTPRSAA